MAVNRRAPRQPNQGGTSRYAGSSTQGATPPILSQEMIQRLETYGETQTFEASMTLFERGSRGGDMFVVIEGRIELFEDKPGAPRCGVGDPNKGPIQWRIGSAQRTGWAVERPNGEREHNSPHRCSRTANLDAYRVGHCRRDRARVDRTPRKSYAAIPWRRHRDWT